MLQFVVRESACIYFKTAQPKTTSSHLKLSIQTTSDKDFAQNKNIWNLSFNSTQNLNDQNLR